MSRTRRPPELELEIESLDAQGLGVSRVESRLVRVRNALVGEAVRARVVRKRRGEWLADTVDLESSSAVRREPACGYFPRCGGCSMQHLDYTAQIEHKEQRLLALLEQAGVRPGYVLPPVLGPRLRYRTKARLGIRAVRDDVLIGFRERFSSLVTRMDGCETLVPELSRLIVPLKDTLRTLSTPARLPQVELAAGDRRQAMILRHLETLSARDLRTLEAFAQEQDIAVFTQHGGYESIVQIGGAPRELTYSNMELGLVYRFLPWEFTQVNLTMNRALVRSALLALSAPPGARVLDLFCGIGNFSLALARAGLDVMGYEAEPGAIDRARANAALNGLEERCEFALADLYDRAGAEIERARYMVVDPPRSGAGANLPAWIEGARVERLVYVSCEPGSFAKDAATLEAIGLNLEGVGIFDMFPHTAHVETLGIFARRW